MATKIGRNDPCPCGSGMKYKKCCYSSDTRPEETTRQGKFRFEPGSYGHPQNCMPSIACLQRSGESWEYHFVLVKPAAVLDDPDQAHTIATTDLNSAFSGRTTGGSDEAVAMFLKERGYLRVEGVNVAHPDSEVSASWMENDGLHVMAPGPLLTPEQLDAATATYQRNLRDSPLWDQMVREFGEEAAEKLLSECRVKQRP